MIKKTCKLVKIDNIIATLEIIKETITEAKTVIDSDEKLRKIFSGVPDLELYKIIQDTRSNYLQEKRAFRQTLREWLWIAALLCGAIVYGFNNFVKPIFR